MNWQSTKVQYCMNGLEIYPTKVNDVVLEVLQTVFFSELKIGRTERFQSSGLQNWQSKFQG